MQSRMGSINHPVRLLILPVILFFMGKSSKIDHKKKVLNGVSGIKFFPNKHTEKPVENTQKKKTA
jgi:hypothetical protein